MSKNLHPTNNKREAESGPWRLMTTSETGAATPSVPILPSSRTTTATGDMEGDYRVLAGSEQEVEQLPSPSSSFSHAATAEGKTNGLAPVPKEMEEEDRDPDLPTPFQLWKYCYSEVLFGNPLCRDLVWINLAIHAGCWAFFASLLWAFFLGYLPFNIAFKIYFFGLMGLFAVSSDVWGVLICAAILVRLREQQRNPRMTEVIARVFRQHRLMSLLNLAAVSTAVRMLYITANNIIPLCGVFIVPTLVRRYFAKATGVAWVEQFDMTLTAMIMQRVGYPTGRYRAIDYYLKRWGREPMPTVRMDSVIIPPVLLLVLGVVIPMVVVGKKQDNKPLMAAGFTISICIFAFVQFMRPLSGNIYCMAAYCYSEHGRRDIFPKYPDLPKHAFRSLAAEREEKAKKKREKEALGKEDKDGWVHLDTSQVVAVSGAAGEEGEERSTVGENHEVVTDGKDEPRPYNPLRRKQKGREGKKKDQDKEEDVETGIQYVKDKIEKFVDAEGDDALATTGFTVT